MATEYTEEQIAEVQAILAERQRQAIEAAERLAAEQRAAEDAALAPLRAWLDTDCVTQAIEELDEFIVSMRDMPSVSPYAYNFLAALKNAAGPLPVAPGTPTEEGNTDGE